VGVNVIFAVVMGEKANWKQLVLAYVLASQLVVLSYMEDSGLGGRW